MRHSGKVIYRLLIGGILFLTLLTGCGGGGGSGGDSSPTGGDAVLASATIGTGGGTVATSDGKVALNIPAGALSESTNITISSTDTQGAVGEVYKLEPSGTIFTQPVEVTISYVPTALPVNVAEDDLFLVTENEDGYLEPLTDISVNVSNHKVTGQILHFSEIGITHGILVEGISADDTTWSSVTSFRVPIGDSRDLSNLTISCGYSVPSNIPGEDLGDNINLLKTDLTFNNGYPKDLFNENGTYSNGTYKWYVKTNFNKNQYVISLSDDTLLNYGAFHNGEDWNIDGNEDGGRPVHAIADGIILFNQKQWSKYIYDKNSKKWIENPKTDQTISFGNIVVIGHRLSNGNIIASVYAHMKDISPCSVGKRVNKGDIIGLIGTTGNSTGPHLHFEIINTSIVENASSKVWQSASPLIDESSKKIYISYSKTENKEAGWYWPAAETKILNATQEKIIQDNYYDPSDFIKTHSDTTAPWSPSVLINSGVSLTTTTSVTLTLSATDNVGVTGYYASETSTTPSASASGWTSVTSTTSYSATVSFTLSSGSGIKTVYVWFKDAAGNISASSSDSITLGSAPLAPTGVSASAGNGQATISWTSVSDATSYNIYWSTTTGVTKTTGTKITNATGPYTHTGLTNGTTYYYVVTAVNSYGESSESSQVSATPRATGTLQGYVKDAVTRSGLSGVTISIYDSSGNLASSKTTDSSGIYTATLTVGTYSLSVTKTGYISESISNVTIQENVTTTVETILQVSTTYSGTGTISGTIKNALDGTGVSGVTINFRNGINVTTGTIATTATTNSSGAYSVSTLNAGNYTGEATKSGFTTAYFTVTVIGGQTTSNQDATITPLLSSGETRIVLTWGSTPYDLDSHLTGPISGSSSRFHIYFSNMGSSTSSPYVALDVDDTLSYGPETITIYQQFTGTYRYSVHDYSNSSSSSSTALSNSSAKIKVYRGSSLVATFNVPVNQGGTLWTVFEMSGDTITPKNIMSYESSSGNIQKPSLEGMSDTDAPLMRNLPLK